MPVKILTIPPPDRVLATLEIHGQTFDVHPLSVDGFLMVVHLEDQVPLNGAPSVDDNVQTLITLIRTMVPDCPEVVLRRVTLAELRQIRDFVQEVMQESLAKNSETPTEAVA